MVSSKFTKNKRIFTLFLIATTTGFFTLSQMIWNFNNAFSDSSSLTEFDLLNRLKISDYSSNFVNSGENMNITLHQSYLNTSFDTLLNNSIVNGNNFTLPSPTDLKFNSSYARFEIKDIIAPNITLNIESGISNKETMVFGDVHAFSFNALNTSMLFNFSICLSE